MLVRDAMLADPITAAPDESFESLIKRLVRSKQATAAVIDQVHKDEIEHVRFGLEWLRRLKPAGQSDWETFTAHLHWPMRPAKAVGHEFHRAPREAAGMDAEFVFQLEHVASEEPGGS